MTGSAQMPVLSVRGLTVAMRKGHGSLTVVDKVGFDLMPGEILALVGESGCGKTKTAEALLGLIPPLRGAVAAERLLLRGPPDSDLVRLPEAQMRRLRGSAISMVFQDPATALDPVFTIGTQLAVLYRRHRGYDRRQSRAAALDMLARVGFADPERSLASYPHELSGGMRQRVGIAMAMACQPRVLLADEPTTALDVTTQAQVLGQLTGLAREYGTAILLITHDLGLVAHYCDRALVMRGGRIVEEAPVPQLFAQPAAAYTAELLARARAATGLQRVQAPQR
jgi:ABC-type dipeptide/oligopeptide/nickel transport system ATPase component